MKKKHIETIIVICAGMLVLGRLYRSWNYVYISGGLAVLGFSWKWFRENLYRAWMKIAEALGFISGKILLTIVFVIVVIPLSFLAKWRGKLSIRLKPGGGSYFKERNHTYNKSDLHNPW